ncbi:hypothetical protein N7488_001495 [Penicillium malachiteum]|nr:hypothetical protein N7488_001495 [Penicillium malachiteum]
MPTEDARFPGEEVFDVAQILDRRSRFVGRPRRDGTRTVLVEYLVRWEGQSPLDDEWVRLEDLIGCEELVAEFHDREAL